MKTLSITLVILLSLVMLIPLFLMFSGSFISAYETAGAPQRLIPKSPSLEAYSLLLDYPIFRWFLNSLFITVLGTILGMYMAVSVAFAISKYTFRGRSIVFASIILTLLLPGYITLIPSYVLVRGIGLYNNYWAVILPGLFDAGAIWFLIKYMNAIPRDFTAMGRLDGLGPLGLLRHVIIPMSMPPIIALSSMKLVVGWQSYFWPLVMLRKRELFPILVGIREVVFVESVGQQLVGEFPRVDLAGAVIATIPGIILFLSLQKYFVGGLFAKTSL